MRIRALRDGSKYKTGRPPARGMSGTFAVPTRQHVEEHCKTKGYIPRIEKTGRGPIGRVMINLSPSLKASDPYADPIELALEEHGEMLPEVITDPGLFTTQHHYVNPRDPGAHPKHCAVTTICRGGRLRTFVHRPNETLSVFGI